MPSKGTGHRKTKKKAAMNAAHYNATQTGEQLNWRDALQVVAIKQPNGKERDA